MYNSKEWNKYHNVTMAGNSSHDWEDTWSGKIHVWNQRLEHVTGSEKTGHNVPPTVGGYLR